MKTNGGSQKAVLNASPDNRFVSDAQTAAKAGAKHKHWRIFVVDDFPLTRSAVADWINRFTDFEVCGEASNEWRALKAVKRLKPHLVLTEVMRQHDLGFINELHRRHPRLPILVFSFRDEGWYAPKALQAGARGYLMKGVNVTRLAAGIRDVLKGRVVLSPEMAFRLRSKRSAHGPRRKWSRILAT